jgi:hypothetical protein
MALTMTPNDLEKAFCLEKAICGEKRVASVRPVVIDLDQYDRFPASLGCKEVAEVPQSGSSLARLQRTSKAADATMGYR